MSGLDDAFRIYKIRSYQESLQIRSEMQDLERSITRSLRELIPTTGNEFTIKGYSYPAKEEVEFLVQKDANGGINWRETICCPITGLVNRARVVTHLLDLECKLGADSSIYLSEQSSKLYQYLKKEYPNLVGSEYVGAEIAPGTIVDDFRHEDLTNLSFLDESMHAFLSFDCFEHILDPRLAYKEAFRVLKSGGVMFWSVPFSYFSEFNIQRAKLDEGGKLIHLMEPEYHGDPRSEEGILSYYIFGWEMLEQVREVGFKDVYSIFYYSTKYAYLGAYHCMFFAFK